MKNWALLSKEILREPSGDIYLERWHIIVTPWFGVYLHKFHRPDKDQDLHDHPWDFTTFILSNGYYEVMPPRGCSSPYSTNRTVMRFPWSKVSHKAEDLHRVALFFDPKKPVWTLFLRGRKYREWGFMTKNGWVHNKEYKKERDSIQ